MSHRKKNEDEKAATSGDFHVRSTATTTTTMRTTRTTMKRVSSELEWGVASATVAAPLAASTPSTSAAAATAAKLSLPPNAQIETGFKHYGPRMRLYCRTGFCLTILADGSVIGDPLGNHSSGVLEFTSAGIGEVRIRGVETNLYLAMNAKGTLYGEEDPSDYATVFVESIYGQYNTYLSQKYAHRGWYVGIKKNGVIKKASQTKHGQKAIQFLPVRA